MSAGNPDLKVYVYEVFSSGIPEHGGVSQIVPKSPVVFPFIILAPFCSRSGPNISHNDTKQDKRGGNGTKLPHVGYTPIYQGGTNVHLSNVHFVPRDISAFLDPSWGS